MATRTDDLRELIGEFLVAHGAADPVVGQIVYAPIPYLEMTPTVARAARALVHVHARAQIDFAPLDASIDFRKAKDRLPLAYLQLSEEEEMLAIKAKKRPAIIVGISKGVPCTTLPSGIEQRKAQRAFDPIYLVAPIYSTSTAHKPTSFGPTLTARIKCMAYPEFVWIKSDLPASDVEGVIRLDRMVATHLHSCCDFKPVKVTDEVMGLCMEQLKVLVGQSPSKEYSEFRDLMLDLLPEHAKVSS